MLGGKSRKIIKRKLRKLPNFAAITNENGPRAIVSQGSKIEDIGNMLKKQDVPNVRYPEGDAYCVSDTQYFFLVAANYNDEDCLFHFLEKFTITSECQFCERCSYCNELIVISEEYGIYDFLSCVQ